MSSMHLLIFASFAQDRQESAERMAMELAEELQKVRLEKEALESRTKALEQALGDHAKLVGVQHSEQQAGLLAASGYAVF